MIYFDNAATTIKKPQCVLDAVYKAMNSMGNSGRGVHDGSIEASRMIYETREKLAQMFSCNPDHVVFTSNSTEALNIAIAGILNSGDHVITTDCEHNSVLRPVYRHGNVDFVPADKKGNIQYDDFKKLIRPQTKAIVTTHASNLTGNILDIENIGRIAHEFGLIYILDASQTAGILPINMKEMHIDVLCFTGHKSLHGPQGTGGLCIGDGIEIRPLKVGGTGVQTYLKEQPEKYPVRLEAGTLNGHGIAGLNAALEYFDSIGWAKVHEKEMMLMNRFYKGIKNIDNVQILGDIDDAPAERAPIVSINIGDYDSGKVADVLNEEYGIATRAGAHCAPRLHEALDTVKQGAVRFSFDYYNTCEEVDIAISAVKEIASC